MSAQKVDISAYKAADFRKDLPGLVKAMDQFRSGGNKKASIDISLEDMVQKKYGLGLDAYFDMAGVNPKVDTISNLFEYPDENYRWIIPEIIRSAILLGVRKAPFYPNIIASEQSTPGLTQIMPFINMSDAVPAKVNEAETIPLGTISFGQKSVTLFKMGKGIKITDEVRDYVSLDVLGIYFRDFGIQLGYTLDNMAMDVLINGNMTDGSESAPVVGVDTVGSITYRDLLRIWVRGARLGRNFQTMIGGEEAAIDILNLPEFKLRQPSGPTYATLNVKTPVPNSADFFVHPGVPDDQVALVDPSAAMIKLNAKQLMLESERIVSNQTEAVYASLTTGFAKMFADSVILLDDSLDFATNGFPDFLNIDPYLMATLE